MKEIISVHVGQGGVSTGNEMWQMFAAEHALTEGKQAPKSFFNEGQNGTFKPRAIFADTEGDSMHYINKTQFDKDDYILNNDSADNLYSKGRYMTDQLTEKAMNLIDSHAEKCDSLDGFLFTHTNGGGTGSGFTSKLLKKLQEEKYGKKTKCTFSIFPGYLQSMSQFPVASTANYNAVLNLNDLKDAADLTVVYQNELIWNICNQHYDIPRPTLNDANKLIASSISAITSPIRFGGSAPYSTLEELVQTMVDPACPQRKLVQVNLVQPKNVTTDKEIIESVMNQKDELSLFQPESIQKATENPLKFAQDCYILRGDFDSKTVQDTFSNFKAEIQESPYISGFKHYTHAQPTSIMAKTVWKLSNCQSIEPMMSNLLTSYQRNYCRRVYVHQYVRKTKSKPFGAPSLEITPPESEGMTEEEFNEADQGITSLIDYYLNKKSEKSESEEESQQENGQDKEEKEEQKSQQEFDQGVDTE